jgi:phosphoenolpyruvate synthase/pyruvate phosphate dikinase
MQYTKNFTELGKDDAPIAGGKGASLGEMTSAGIPVPGGYVVLADTFDAFLRETDLVQEIEAILDSVNHEAIHTVEAASENIQSLILSRPMPEVMQTEIHEQFVNLGSQYVAVRSSATAEDGAEHAWAGQLDSYLNTTEVDLIEKVRKCWASLFTPRAIFYRFEKGLHTTHISVAVVVQKMVNSEISGIAFSVHPVTEDYNQLIIEAGFGLGEAIVSGSVTPDSYVVEKSPRNILDINVSHQGRALYRVDGGGSEWKELTESFGSSQVLTEVQINELSDIILRIENHYGFPCDIEWAFEEGVFYIVQSRPITTLTPRINNETPHTEKNDYLTMAKQDLGNHEPLIIRGSYSPLFVSTWSLQSGALAIYWVHKNGESIAIFDLDEYKKLAINNIALCVRSIEELRRFEAFYAEYVEKIQILYFQNIEKDFSQETEQSLVEKMHEAQRLFDELVSKTLCIEFITDEVVQDGLMKAGIACDSYKTLLEQAVHQPFESFEERYKRLKGELVAGHSSVSQSLIDKASYLYTDYKNTKDAREIEDDLTKYIGYQCEGRELSDQEYKSSLGEAEKSLYEYLRLAVTIRDNRKDQMAMCQALFQKIGIELFERAGLPKEDVFFTTPFDYFGGVQGLRANQEMLSRRNEGVEIYAKPVEQVLVSLCERSANEVEKIFSIADKNQKEIKGDSASRGCTQGRVRIVLDPDKTEEFLTGDILVTSMTRPEFVPLMKQAGAIVTNEGGITCHAAIVSRELNIPCVIGTKIATQVLKDGDMVEVDADHGVVRILKDESPSATIFSSVDEYTKFGRWVAPTIEVELWLDWSHTPEAAKLDVPYNPNPDVVSLDGHFFVRNTGAYPYIQERILGEFQSGKTNYADAILDVAQDLTEKCTERALQIGTHSTIEDLERDFDLMRRLRFPWWACFALSDAADTMIEGYAKEQGLSIDDITAALPQLPSSLTRDQEALQSFRQEIESAGLPFDLVAIEKANPELVARLVSYQKQTEYLGTHHFWGEARLIPVFMDALQKAHALEEYESVHAYTDIEHVLKAAGRGAQLRLECAQSGARLAYTWRPFLESLAGQIGLTYDEIIFLTLDEIKEVYASKSVDISMVKDRAKKAGIYKTDDAVKVLWGQELEDHLEQFVPEETIVDVDELKGNIANKGKAQGRVVIVLTPKDAERVEKGTILVAPETTPDFIPAMGRAAAFVTDRGGITSHAAIVAREMKKPCIIGTKIATQVLKDGDLVEVDADNGVVRILKKTNGEGLGNGIPLIKENTVFTFESTGTTFLFEDIVSHHYIKWECIRVAKGDNVRVFVKQEEVERMHREGAAMTKAFLEDKVQLMEEKSAHIKDHIQTLKAKTAMSVDDVKAFFEPLEVICDNYSFFDIHYSDAMVLSDGFTEAGKYVQETKNILRDILGEPFFSEEGWLHVGLSILAKQFSISVETLTWYTKTDIENLFDGKAVDDEVICNRKVANVAYRDRNGDIDLRIGNEALTYFQAFEEVSYDDSHVQGVVAHKGSGSVQGKVRVVKKDFSDPSLLLRVSEQMEEGEILVTDTTDPDFLPIMKKAGAIVTDVGGMLSHASITSRELGKLCVVGTVKASKVFQDGDLVEVDAETGVVRILSRDDLHKAINEEKEIKWEHYLTRPFTLFQTSLWHMWYTSPLAEEILGGRAYNALYRQIGMQEIEHLRPAGQITLWKKNLVSLYENNPKQLANYLRKGIEYNERFVAEETAYSILEEAVEFSLDMAMYATIIPLLVGEYILENEDENSPLYQDVITLRSRSYYGDVFNQYIIPLAEQRLENRDIDRSLLPFVSYEELDLINEKELSKRKQCHDKGEYFIYCCGVSAKQLTYQDKIDLPIEIASVTDWEFYLEREQPLFVFAAFIETYGSLLKEVTGFGYQQQLHFFKNGLGIFYRSQKEMQEALRYFAELLDQEDARIGEWLQKEKEIFTKLESYESLEDLEAILDAYLVATLYNPTINYRLQASTEFTQKNVSQEIIDQLESSRSRSFYPYFMDKVMPRFFASVAKIMGVENGLATLLTPDELRSVIAGKGYPTKEELQKRQAGCYFYLTQSGAIEFYYGQVPVLEKSIEVPQELKGNVAFKGKVTGEVCVINTTAQIEKMKEGDILVSINTNPSLMSAIQKAGAIVTDEGGITCHAAIISRELKKPCIIGTKIATKVLKDGDLVEVDAETGVVRILEKNKARHTAFTLSYTRDTTLFMQELWTKSLIKFTQEKFGWQNPHLPLIAHYENEGVVEIWQNMIALGWFLDKMLEINLKGVDFVQGLYSEYESLLFGLKKIRKQGLLNESNIDEYRDKVSEAVFIITAFIYIGTDERTPDDVKNICVKAREIEDLFADSDLYVRESLQARYNLSSELAGVVLASEFTEIPDSEVLKRRLESYLLIDGQEVFKGSLTEFEKTNKNFSFTHESTNIEDTEALSGQVAFQGYAKGAVRIVRKQADIKNVEVGAILVSPMTTPDFLPAMKKASAFVTDEGGITCHAAIVAREMKKPCIIGTKIATQVLKDGDEIEVDAEQGIVKIIKRA